MELSVAALHIALRFHSFTSDLNVHILFLDVSVPAAVLPHFLCNLSNLICCVPSILTETVLTL